MLEFVENVKRMLEDVVNVKSGEDLLVVTDTYALSRTMAHTVAEVASSMGAHAVLMIMDPLPHIGAEPSACVAAAMKAVDVIVEFGQRTTMGHSTAGVEARKAGVRRFMLHTDVSEDYLRTPIPRKELNKIRMQTEKLAEIMTRASVARVTTPYGTDVTMSLKGRQALPLGVPNSLLDYAEAAIAPVEGTTEGIVVADASVRTWEFVLRSPIRFEVKKGRARVESVSSDVAEQVERFKGIVMLDENSSNFAAELGIGTNHLAPKHLCGDAMRDYGRAGNVHMALGRNNDIGGETYSKIHNDVLMTRATVTLDGQCVVENGELKA